MKLRQLFLATSLLCFAHMALADLEAWTDYDIGEGISNVTTVKVDSNMIDKYLEGLSKTWAPANEVAIKLGQMESYSIFVSTLANSGDFNVILVTRFKNADALQPRKDDYDAFMEEWGDANQATNDEIVPTYPDIRKIVGEYNVREITLK